MTGHAGWKMLLAAGVVAFTAGNAEAAPRKKSPVRKPAAAVKADSASTLLKETASLQIVPASAVLDGSRAEQRLAVIATLKDGATWDATDRVQLVVSNPRVIRIAGGCAKPLGDGESKVTAKLGQLASPPTALTVRNAKAPATIEFVNDVMPIMAKASCNATQCHGSPAGKGGLKLSLFGYEPELDHPAIMKGGKLVNTKDPAQSPMLLKPAMAVPHAGGQRFKIGSPEYQVLLAWIKEGAPGIGEFEARVRKVEVLPAQPWMPAPGARQRLIVMATMSDGTSRDVTDKALFSSNEDAIASVDPSGVVSAQRPGETAIMIRHLGQVAVSRVAVLPAVRPNPYPKLARSNYVDELVQAKLQKLRAVPSDLCSDEEFIRRAFLDVCGIIPTPDEVRAFTSDSSADKRSKLVEKLLERPEFVDLWTLKWNDTLRNNPRLTRRGLVSYYTWIRERVEKNRPYDEWVRELLTATGKSADVQLTVDQLPPAIRDRPNAEFLVAQVNRVPYNGAANYFAVTRDTLDMTSATSQVFLGVRIECARCHNHPFEKWTQNDYYGMASFFTGVQARGQNQLPAVVTVNTRAPGLRHPKTNEVVEPRTLDNEQVKIDKGEDKRVALAEWITSPANPFFARAAVNRIWGHYLGRGIVEPIDDFRVTNPPSNPELLDALAKELVDRKFDLKQTHRTILNSRTYQQSSRPNDFNRTDTSNFARFYPKRMMAEQLYDSISQATGIFLPTGPGGGRRGNGAFAGNPYLRDMQSLGPITRAMQLPATGRGGGGRGAGDLAQFLDTFGKPRREVVCECERSADGNIGQALALINGNEVNDKLRAPQGRVQQLIGGAKPDAEVIEELYLATLSRKPSALERDEAAILLRSSKTRGEGVEDLMWSLLNSREFLFNH